MKPSLPTPTKVHALFLAIFVFAIGIVNAQQPENELNDSRTVNTPYEIPSQLKSGSTTSILVEPVHGTSWTPEKLVQDVFLGSGSCAIISNITYTGDSRAIGYFKRNPENPAFPFEQGIILSTGRVTNAIGPNNMINTSSEFNTSGDPDINKISAPHPSYDAAVLTFDFQPATSSLTFRYIFASDEYPQWACSQYNDVFGFFISGPGITPDPDGFNNGAKNIALLPDGVTPVSINNIHVDGWNDYTHSGPNASCPDVNAEYYVAVAPGSTTIEYDGRTVVLSATIDNLSPCSNYKLKLAIADVSDRKLDSAVFLEALSFDTGSDIQFKNFNFNGVETSEIFKSCNPNTLRIERTNGDNSVAKDVTYTVSGTAVYNTHHTLQGGTVTIPAGQSYVEIPYSTLDNPIPGGAATIIVETITGCLCDPDPVILSRTINLYETYALESIVVKNPVSCLEDDMGSITVSLTPLSSQFDFFYTYNLKNSSGTVVQTQSTQNTQHTFSNIIPGTYTVEVTDNASCTVISQSNINVVEQEVAPPTLSLDVSGDITCLVSEVTITATSNGTVEWYFEDNSVGTGLTLLVSSPGTYTAIASNNEGCISSETIDVEEDVTPPLVSHDPVGPVCMNELPLILGPVGGAGVYTGSAVGVSEDNYIFDPTAAGDYTVTYIVTGENGCTDQEDLPIVVNAIPDVTLDAFEPVCSGSDVFELTGGLPAGGVYNGQGVDENGYFNPSIAGNYTITYSYTDPETGCSNEATSLLVVNQAICLTVTSKNISCNGAADGNIKVSVSCGDIAQLTITGPEGFNYTSGETIETDFDNLVAGTYIITGVSVDGCSTSQNVEITEPSAVAINLAGKNNVSAEGADDGSIEINISGGTPGYDILWNIGETDSMIDNLAPGTYSVVVFDANNCTASDSFEIIIDNGSGDILVDLGITIEVNIATPDPDHVDELIFALVLKNHSSKHDATGVEVLNKLPAEFPFMQRLDDGTSGEYDPATGIWEIGTLPAGQHVILVYKTEMLLIRPEKSSSSAVNAAQILPFEQTDPNLLNNYAEVVVTVGESTSGDDNGIESNGNMASQLALRNYRRMVESRSITKDQRLAVMNEYSHTGMLKGNLKSAKVDPGFSTGINMLLPENGPVQTKAFISTPEDLLNITNAREIFAVDYLQENNSRRAAILAISTEPSRVYEHTKVICDRLIGAELHEVRMVEISGKPFIMSKLVHPNGYVDYSVSFIVQQTNNGFEVDSRWYNDEYRILNTDEIFNFQVWGAAPQFTVELVENILENIHKSGRVKYHNALETPSIPQVYVQSGRYTSGGLLLNLVNKAGANQITLTGNKTTYENGEREPLHVTMSIPAGELVEVFIPTGFMFDAGFAITNNKHDAADVLYYADGPWMFDYDPGNSTVTNFATFAETQEILSKTTKVERDATFAGNVRTYASMFRALAPRQAPVDLSEYDMVVFEASGKGTVEVMLAKAGIDSWAEQFRSVINLDEKSRQFSVKFKDLANKEGAREFTPEDVVSIIFNAIGNGASESSYEVNVKNLHFANSMLVRNQNATFMPAYPNPFTERTWIDFSLMEENHVKVEIMNIMGQTIEVLMDEFTSAGAHQLEWKPVNHQSGIFLMKLTVGEESYTSKLIYKN